MPKPASFAAQLAAFQQTTKLKLDDLARDAVDDLADTASAGVPVRSGRLKRSLVSALNDGELQPGKAAIATGQAGDIFFVGWKAFYAIFVARGSGRGPARMFASIAAEQWDAIVTRNADRIRNRR